MEFIKKKEAKICLKIFTYIHVRGSKKSHSQSNKTKESVIQGYQSKNGD